MQTPAALQMKPRLGTRVSGWGSVGMTIASRVLSGIVTLFGISILIFIAIHLIPGSYEQVVLGPLATAQAKAQLASEYGLDDPLPVQYFKWLGQVVTGDFGVSLVTQLPVAPEFVRRAPVTIELAVMALVISLLVGIPLALVSGLAGNRRAARNGSRMAGALAMSVPDFVLGSVFVYLFSRFDWFFTVGKYESIGADPVANFQAMFLPALTLSVFGIAVIARTGRDAVQEATRGLYVTAAVAAGESRRQIIRRHVLRNASIPVLTVTTTFAGYILGGAVVIEMLYSLPGVGLYVYNGIHNRDYAVVQAGVMLAAAIFVAINIVTDILYGVLDPRIGARKGRG